MTVTVIIDDERLKEALRKIYDYEILFKVTESGVVLRGFNSGEERTIHCDVYKNTRANYPERLFPRDEIRRWLKLGNGKLKITFVKDYHIGTYRDYTVEVIEEVKV